MRSYVWTTRVFTIAVFDDCGGEFSGQGGEIVSPGYPDIYPNNSVCVWTVTGAEGDIIRVTFKDFDLEDSQDCQLDFLEVTSHTVIKEKSHSYWYYVSEERRIRPFY